MINFTQSLKKNLNEKYSVLPGLYSNFDSRILYSFIREYKPKSILDIAPRQGKTTSSIIEALFQNAHESKEAIDYYVFEKDLNFYDKIMTYLNTYVSKFKDIGVEFRIHNDTNIINSKVLESIESLDFLFIDANHDYILSAYLVDKVATKVKDGGYVHFHDMHINLHGNGLEDLKFVQSGVDHEDIISEINLKKFYPNIYDIYVKHEKKVDLWEGDIVLEYIKVNGYNYFSTFTLSQESNIPKDSTVENCALYIHKVGN